MNVVELLLTALTFHLVLLLKEHFCLLIFSVEPVRNLFTTLFFLNSKEVDYWEIDC